MIRLTKSQKNRAEVYLKAQLLSHLNNDAALVLKVINKQLPPDQLNNLGLTPEVFGKYKQAALELAVLSVRSDESEIKKNP
ncbi:MAG: hypothetical protein AAGA46_03480 [Cyanobacteria bacterium P01_F01_bin.13]